MKCLTHSTHNLNPMGTTLLFKAFFLAFLSTFSLLDRHLVAHAQSQEGFISIDCGWNSSYTEPTTGIEYVSDLNFVESGLMKTISSNYDFNSILKQLWNVRSFPEGIRNCYNIKVKVETKYLIRASFLYANYDAQKSIPEFDIYFGSNLWTTVKLDEENSIYHEEVIHITTSNKVQICLVNTGKGVPFISSIELRPLPNTTYATQSGSLAYFQRIDIGAPNHTFIRYPDDMYDRIWRPRLPNLKWTPLSTSLSINNQDKQGFKAPSKVLSTASTVTNASEAMDIISWNDPGSSNKYYIYIYFAELQLILKPNQSRLFKIYLNDDVWLNENVIVDYLKENVVRTTDPGMGMETYNFKLVMSEGSTLPPILNAIEIYKVIDFTKPTTQQQDVDAIESIKKSYGVTRDWQGDPCLPKLYAWQGVNCTYDDDNSNSPIIRGLSLSSSGLTGEISTIVSNLPKLEFLDLSNNNLSGAIPDFLAQMPLLSVLILSGNNLSGKIPSALIDKRNKGILSLSVEGNPSLYETPPSEKKSNMVVPIIAAVGSAFIILMLILAALHFIRRRSTQGPITVESHSLQHSVVEQYHPVEAFERPSLQYSFMNILKMTDNFGRLLGEGGFGRVYYGVIDNTEVAVKMLSQKSVQGYREFQAEVELLLRVHHKNLTSLVGYCNDGDTKMGLVYEYMSQGDLRSILSSKTGVILRWVDRLQIAIDAAQGLEYLHNGCTPPMIHRDIKSSNILLNENLRAKLADFGLSRAFPIEGSATHVTTKIVGTLGYLDPEYYSSYKLTEKSDVYSFGVVLLELVTGRPVLVKTDEKSHIIQWVCSNINQGDIYSTIDLEIKESCNVNSVWKVVDIAMSCIVSDSTKRPKMNQVVSGLNEALRLELNERGSEHQVDSTKFISEYAPLAR